MELEGGSAPYLWSRVSSGSHFSSKRFSSDSQKVINKLPVFTVYLTADPEKGDQEDRGRSESERMTYHSKRVEQFESLHQDISSESRPQYSSSGYVKNSEPKLKLRSTLERKF